LSLVSDPASVGSLTAIGGFHGVDGGSNFPSGNSSVGEPIISPGGGNSAGCATACATANEAANANNAHANRMKNQYPGANGAHLDKLPTATTRLGVK
jgi:hypothetical protein